MQLKEVCPADELKNVSCYTHQYLLSVYDGQVNFSPESCFSQQFVFPLVFQSLNAKFPFLQDLETPSKQRSASTRQKANSRAALKSCTNVLEVSRAEGELDERKGSPNQKLLPVVRTQRNLACRPSVAEPSVNVKNLPCKCFSGSYVCDECTKKPVQYAYRAGTPGFRAPEVLMKCPSQTTGEYPKPVSISSSASTLFQRLLFLYPCSCGHLVCGGHFSKFVE